jgi:hypothetical protein
MHILNRLIPFLLAMTVFAVMVFGLILLANVLLVVIAAGAVFMAIRWVRRRFIPTTSKTPPTPPPSGRIIDSDDWHKL